MIVIAVLALIASLTWFLEKDSRETQARYAAQTAPQKTTRIDSLQKVFMHSVGEYSYMYREGNELKTLKIDDRHPYFKENAHLPAKKITTVILADAKQGEMHVEIQTWLDKTVFILHVDSADVFNGGTYSPMKNQQVQTQVVR